MGTDKANMRRRPSLSVLALISFAVSFLLARIFTILYPEVNLTAGGYHIHHFWYGLALLGIGGWLGISYNDERIDRLAAIVYGAGGGIIGDEVGLLLTLGDYRTETTYMIVILFLTFISTLILLRKYSGIIRKEFAGFTRRNVSLYFAVFLAAVSIAFITETENMIIIAISSASTVTACLIIAAYFVQRIIRTRR